MTIDKIISSITVNNANPHETRKGFNENEVISLSEDGTTYPAGSSGIISSGSIIINDFTDKT